MIAVDTNVVLRLVLEDDAVQVAAVRSLMSRTRLFVSVSVLLEAGWVLQSRYRLSREDVAETLMLLVSLDRIVVSRHDLVDWAIDRYRDGGDLADMLHLVSAVKLGRFATFDRRLVQAAGSEAPVTIETLP